MSLILDYISDVDILKDIDICREQESLRREGLDESGREKIKNNRTSRSLLADKGGKAKRYNNTITLLPDFKAHQN